jgi:hypothetical protein
VNPQNMPTKTEKNKSKKSKQKESNAEKLSGDITAPDPNAADINVNLKESNKEPNAIEGSNAEELKQEPFVEETLPG